MNIRSTRVKYALINTTKKFLNPRRNSNEKFKKKCVKYIPRYVELDLLSSNLLKHTSSTIKKWYKILFFKNKNNSIIQNQLKSQTYHVNFQKDIL